VSAVLESRRPEVCTCDVELDHLDKLPSRMPAMIRDRRLVVLGGRSTARSAPALTIATWAGQPAACDRVGCPEPCQPSAYPDAVWISS